MRPRVAVLGTLGALATALAVAVVTVPDALTITPVRTITDALGAVNPQLVMLVGTVVAGLYVALAARSTGGTRPLDAVTPAERAFEAAATDPPEGVTDDRRRRTAAGLDADIETAVERGGPTLRRVRTVLAETAASAYAHHESVSREEARRAIETGTWTGDDVAAAFLASVDGPRPGLYARVRLWLLPAAERERRIARTVAATRRLGEVPE